MTSVQQIIDSFGGATAVSRIVERGPSTSSEWKRNGSIPVRYWPRLVEAAKDRGIEGITYEALALAHAKGQQNQVSPAA